MRTIGYLIAAVLFVIILVIFVYPNIIVESIPNDQWRSDFIHATSINGKDKIGHFFLTGISAFLLNVLLKGRLIHLLKRPFFFGSIFMIGFVTVEEFYQLWDPKRNFELLDMFFNFAGVFLFERLYCRLFKKRTSLLKESKK